MMKDESRMMKDDDFKLLRGFADRLTDERTFVIVESLSRLKIKFLRTNLNFTGFNEMKTGVPPASLTIGS